MAAEPGGIASKLGGIYERRYGAELLFRMVAGRVRRLRWEPASGERGGADIDLEHIDGIVEHVQLKRQNRSDAEWSVAALDREGVLPAAARFLSSDPRCRFTFVSADPVPHLKDICEQLGRNSDSAEEFVRLRVRSNANRHAVFVEVVRRWGLDVGSTADVATAIARLRSMRFVLLDRSSDGLERLLLSAQQTLTTDPEETIALLSSFLEDQLGRDVLQQDVLEYLQAHGVRPRDLARDPSLPSALLALREEFQASLRNRLVAGTWIRRSQVTDAVQRLVASYPPRVLLVHGKPGAGKSGVLLGILDELIERGVSVLPLTLATRPPAASVYEYGKSLGLHASPVAALQATAGSHRAVLLVDQLDALRLTTSGAAATWQTCSQMLQTALSDPNISLVAACRTFDLENDPNIRRWKEEIEQSHPGGIAALEVADLAPADVEAVLRSVQVEYTTLPSRLQQLILHPSTLDAWYRLVKRGSGRRDFATQTQLLSALIETLRLEASREHHTSDEDVQRVLELARERMEATGRLAVSTTLFGERPTALHACCAVGLLVRTGGSVSFPHQSYFDHLVARSALRASGRSTVEILNWIKRDQSLQRRDQLRQLLIVLREEDPPVGAAVIASVLYDREVRFHLKQLVFGVLRDSESVTSHDVDLILRLAASEEWAEHVQTRVLWRSVAWFDALYSRGIWTTWLTDPRSEVRRGWLNLVCSVMDQRGESVDQLLRPVLSEPGGADLLGTVLPYDPSGDCPSVAAVRDDRVRRGVWSVNDMVLKRVAERDPARAVRLVESAIRGALRRALAASPDDEIEGLRESAFEKQVAQAVRAQAAQSFKAFSRLLRVAEHLKSATESRVAISNDLMERYFRMSSVLTSVIEVLTRLTAESLIGLAQDDPAVLKAVMEQPRVCRSSALSAAVAIGLSLAPKSAADIALQWLCSEPARLSSRASYTRDAHGLAADIIRLHATHCAPETLCALESTLLTYFPMSEKESYRRTREHYPQILAHGHPVGRAQHLLMNAIPQARQSAVLRDRLKTWERKFGPAPAERPDIVSGGWVGSPIPQDRLERLSDRQWLQIVSRRWVGRRWKQLGPDHVAEASHPQFANDFGQSARRDPGRFVRLCRRLPSDIPPVYLARLSDALADRTVDISSCEADDLNALIDRTIDIGDRDAITSACRAIEARPDVAWGDSAWRLLGAAAAHEEPRADEYTMHTGTGATRRPDIETTSLNCVRGVAASALAALAWNDAVRAERVAPLARQLAADPHPAVRLAAAHTAFGVYTIDKEQGASLLLTLVDHEADGILAGRWLNELIGHVRWSHPGQLEPLFERMVRSSDPRVAKAGASWATAEYFQRNCACSTLYRDCSAGSQPQRLGVATTLGFLLADESVDSSAVEADLARFFDDTESDVRAAAAGLFRNDRALERDSGSRLAAVFVVTAAFVDHSESLILPLGHKEVNLAPYASAVFAAADRFARELAPQTRNIQHRLALAGAELSALLLRLYDAACKNGDRSTAESCLDRWDALLASRVGEAESHLELFAAS